MFCLQTTKRINLKPLFFIIYDDVVCVVAMIMPAVLHKIEYVFSGINIIYYYYYHCLLCTVNASIAIVCKLCVLSEEKSSALFCTHMILFPSYVTTSTQNIIFIIVITITAILILYYYVSCLHTQNTHTHTDWFI